MSIKADVQELESIQIELKLLTAKRRALKTQEKKVRARIDSFLESKQQPGVKFQGTAIIRVNKEKREAKKEKEKTKDALAVLTELGVAEPEKALEKILEARKGSKTEVKELKLTKYKEDE